MHIEQAKAADFPELMDMMSISFKPPNGEAFRFEELHPDLYRPTDAAMSCMYIVRDQGRIVATVGLFPMQLRMRAFVLNVAGVGGVSTSPSHRNKGYMAGLLRHARDEMSRQGYALSWLSGERDRYARYGWEQAGVTEDLKVRAPAEASAAEGWTFEGCSGDEAWSQVEADLEALQHAGQCDAETLRLKYGRSGNACWRAERGQQHAHIGFAAAFNYLNAWGGSVDGVRALLAHCMTDDAEWIVRPPPSPDPYRDIFRQLGSDGSPSHQNLSVMNLPGLIEAYRPHFDERWPAGRSLLLQMRGLDGELQEAMIGSGEGASVELDVLEMTRFLFGPERPEYAWLEDVLPLPLYVPALWLV